MQDVICKRSLNVCHKQHILVYSFRTKSDVLTPIHSYATVDLIVQETAFALAPVDVSKTPTCLQYSPCRSSIMSRYKAAYAWEMTRQFETRAVLRNKGAHSSIPIKESVVRARKHKRPAIQLGRTAIASRW